MRWRADSLVPEVVAFRQRAGSSLSSLCRRGRAILHGFVVPKFLSTYSTLPHTPPLYQTWRQVSCLPPLWLGWPFAVRATETATGACTGVSRTRLSPALTVQVRRPGHISISRKRCRSDSKSLHAMWWSARWCRMTDVKMAVPWARSRLGTSR